MPMSDDDAKKLAKAIEDEKHKRSCLGCLLLIVAIVVIAFALAAITA